jgi:hypothetical protein
VADEDVVRPIYGDIVNLIVAVTEFHDAVNDAPRIVSRRNVGRLVRFRSANDRPRALTVIGSDLTDLLCLRWCTALEGNLPCRRRSHRSGPIGRLQDDMAGRDGRYVDYPKYENAVAFCKGTRRSRVCRVAVFRRGRFLDGYLLTFRRQNREARCGHAIDRADYCPFGRPRASGAPSVPGMPCVDIAAGNETTNKAASAAAHIAMDLVSRGRNIN